MAKGEEEAGEVESLKGTGPQETLRRSDIGCVTGGLRRGVRTCVSPRSVFCLGPAVAVFRAWARDVKGSHTRTRVSAPYMASLASQLKSPLITSGAGLTRPLLSPSALSSRAYVAV